MVNLKFDPWAGVTLEMCHLMFRRPSGFKKEAGSLSADYLRAVFTASKPELGAESWSGDRRLGCSPPDGLMLPASFFVLVL